MWRIIIIVLFLLLFLYYISLILISFNIIEMGKKKVTWKSYIPFYQWLSD